MTEEPVLGKQVTIAYTIASSVPGVYEYFGVDTLGAIGILTPSPFETAIIVADIVAKASDAQVGFLDRFTGSMMATGDMESVGTALRAVNGISSGLLGSNVAEITRI